MVAYADASGVSHVGQARGGPLFTASKGTSHSCPLTQRQRRNASSKLPPSMRIALPLSRASATSSCHILYGHMPRSMIAAEQSEVKAVSSFSTCGGRDLPVSVIDLIGLSLWVRRAISTRPLSSGARGGSTKSRVPRLWHSSSNRAWNSEPRLPAMPAGGKVGVPGGCPKRASGPRQDNRQIILPTVQ